jgi:hypothetical protein
LQLLLLLLMLLLRWFMHTVQALCGLRRAR